jgi:hypothetical protein
MQAQAKDFCLLSFVRDFTQGTAPAAQPYVLDTALRHKVIDHCIQLKHQLAGGDAERLDDLHRVLALIYDYRFSVPAVDTLHIDVGPLFADIASILEAAILEVELNAIDPALLDDMPADCADFSEWLRRMISKHPAANHPFYQEYLRDSAGVEGMKLFLAQETTLDPRFDDILALMQVGTSGAEKMEIAKNYFDEMGCGDDEGVHTYLFGKALQALDIDQAYIRSVLLPDALVCGNLSACLATNSRHHYKAVGYFGVTEYLAPRRFKNLVAGWRRLALPEYGLAYHDLHIRIDAMHGKAWFDNVIQPQVEQEPRLAREIALGALIRLNSSARFLDALLLTMMQRFPSAEACAAAPLA